MSIPAGSESVQECHSGVETSSTPTETRECKVGDCVDLGCPNKLDNEEAGQKLVMSQLEDPLLYVCRGLGERAERGYRFVHGILRHVVPGSEAEELISLWV